MWEIGTTAYTLLSGDKPFGYGPHQTERSDRSEADQVGPTPQQKSHQRSKILNGEYNFSDPVWKNISDNAKEFLTALLKVRPSDRLGPKEALEHPWIASQEIDLRSFHYKWRSKARERREAAHKARREKMFAIKTAERRKDDEKEEEPSMMRSFDSKSDQISRKMKTQSVMYDKSLRPSTPEPVRTPRTVPSRVTNERIRTDRTGLSTERSDRSDRTNVRSNLTPTRNHTKASSPSTYSSTSRTPVSVSRSGSSSTHSVPSRKYR